MPITKNSLIADRKTAALQTALIILKSQFAEDKRCIWIVVEGKTDPCYYLNTIGNIIPCDWDVVPVEAGNKENVIEVFKSLDWNLYDKKKILFFVDRDLTDFIGDINICSDNFYVTDGYSIENSLISEYVVFRVLRELLGLNGLTDNEKSSIRTLFHDAKKVFIENMIIPMGIILCIREHNIAIKGLEKIEIKKMFIFSKGKCSLNPALHSIYDYVIEKLNCVGVFSESEIDGCKAKFLSHKNHKDLIRGKYMLSFLVLFANSIRDDWENISFAETRAHGRSLTLGINNAFENIAVRARTVPSLRNFYTASVMGAWLK